MLDGANTSASLRLHATMLDGANTSASLRLHATMLDGANTRARNEYLRNGAERQPDYDSSSWIRTALSVSVERRALASYAYPLCFVNLLCIAWTVLHETATLSKRTTEMQSLDGAYSLTFSAMGFLLVFRLSRAAVRWWDCRASFGAITAGVRDFVDVFLIYTDGSRGQETARTRAADDACAWACAFVVASKAFLRGEKDGPARDELMGILSDEDRLAMSRASHPPLYALSMCRRCVRRAFCGTSSSSVEAGRRDAATAVEEASVRSELNKQCEFLALQVGALERLRSTKIPEVYVIHLRTFLLLYLISMPFVFVNRWGWGTIPAVLAVSFALLGIEGAATECEIPFKPDHINHLKMDAYIMGCFANVSSILEWNSDRANGERRGDLIRADVVEETKIDVKNSECRHD